MKRREILGLAVSGAAGIFVPTLAIAANKDKEMAGGVFYTAENPGRWSKKVAGHLPSVDIKWQNGVANVVVMTAHGMDAHKHYIVKHVLRDEDYKFLDEHMFDPMVDKSAVSKFLLKGYSGKLHILSMCNKHDVWMAEATV